MVTCLFLSIRSLSFTSLIYCSLPVFEFSASRFILERSFIILLLLLYSEIRSFLSALSLALSYSSILTSFMLSIWMMPPLMNLRSLERSLKKNPLPVNDLCSICLRIKTVIVILYRDHRRRIFVHQIAGFIPVGHVSDDIIFG